MSEPSQREADQAFAGHVARQARRRRRARRSPAAGMWFGLGMIGLIGWSIVVPPLLGAAIGQWIDGLRPDNRSWTLALLVAGLVLGCWNAWRWISDQDMAMGGDGNNDID